MISDVLPILQSKRKQDLLASRPWVDTSLLLEVRAHTEHQYTVICKEPPDCLAMCAIPLTRRGGTGVY